MDLLLTWLLAAIGFWTAVPVGVLLAWTVTHGYHAQAVFTISWGIGVPFGAQFDVDRFYWCPVGLLAIRAELL